MESTEPAPQKQKPKLTKEQLRRRGKVNLAIIAVIVVIVIIEIATMGGGKKAQYAASTTGSAVVDPATLSVSFRVTNNGSSSGDPTCTITAQDPSGSDYGTDQFQLQGSLAPGQTTNSADSITITKQGAQYVTQTSVKCQ